MTNLIGVSVLNIIRNTAKNLVYIMLASILSLLLIMSCAGLNITNQIIDNFLENEIKSKEVILEVEGEGINKNELKLALDNLKFINSILDNSSNESSNIEFSITIKGNSNLNDIERIIVDIIKGIKKDSNVRILANKGLDKEENLLQGIKIIVLIMFIGIFIITVLSVRVIINTIIDDKICEIAIYMAVGYKSIHIYIILLYELLILIMNGYIMALLPCVFIINKILPIIDNKLYFYNGNVNWIYIYIVPLIVIVASIMLALNKIINKINKDKLIKLLYQ